MRLSLQRQHFIRKELQFTFGCYTDIQFQAHKGNTLACVYNGNDPIRLEAARTWARERGLTLCASFHNLTKGVSE